MPTAVTDETHPTDLRILPANEVPFADVAAVFGTKGDPAHCWCQWFKIPGRDWRSVGDDGLRDRLEAQLAASDSGPGLLAYDGETPAGWCAVEPRPGLVRLARSRIVAGGTAHPDFTDRDIWAVTCFVVPRAHRKRGIGTALAEAAVTDARERGARIIEGYAVDASPHEKHAAADLFHGTVSMFEAAGFTEVARPTRDRVVMERRLHG